jgi:hypothetical protein
MRRGLLTSYSESKIPVIDNQIQYLRFRESRRRQEYEQWVAYLLSLSEAVGSRSAAMTTISTMEDKDERNTRCRP